MNHFCLALFIKRSYLLLILSMLISTSLCALPTVSKTPCMTIYTPGSILNNNPTEDGIRYAGNRPRFSTCSGVAWGRDNKHIYVVGMHACAIQYYSIDFENNISSLISNCNRSNGFDLARPEGIDISDDGEFLAIPNMRSGQILLYNLKENGCINPRADLVIPGKHSHGVRITPDAHYIVVASTDWGIGVYKLDSGKALLVQKLGLPYFPLKPKTVDFSKDGQFIVIGYCVKLSTEEHKPQGKIVVYKFDSREGRIDPVPVCYTENQLSVETIQFYPDGESFFAVDQINDRVYGYEFDKNSGQIGKGQIVLESKNSKLNMPHGLAFSPNGEFLSVTSYGDDKFTIYRIEK